MHRPTAATLESLRRTLQALEQTEAGTSADVAGLKRILIQRIAELELLFPVQPAQTLKTKAIADLDTAPASDQLRRFRKTA
jgi:hypothetical protein